MPETGRIALQDTSLLGEAQADVVVGPPLGIEKPEAVPTAPDWPMEGLAEDMRPLMADCVALGEPFVLVTLHAAEGGPRPVGTQMLVTRDHAWGFVSGGCVEGDVVLHAREALRDGRPRILTYGRGSRFVDIRLPCGGRIELLLEPIRPGDPAIAALLAAWRARRSVRYLSDGRRRRSAPLGEEAGPAWLVNRLHVPSQRLLVIGGDPFALAIAMAGWQQGWDVTIIRPNGPRTPPPIPVAYRRDHADAALAALAPDEWTAIAVATHDVELDAAALVAALRSKASYVGVLGSRRRLAERLDRLRKAGLSEPELSRLRGPIGLPRRRLLPARHRRRRGRRDHRPCALISWRGITRSSWPPARDRGSEAASSLRRGGASPWCERPPERPSPRRSRPALPSPAAMRTPSRPP
ncbi:Xanthine and CO dehydrogenase maturation factor, XdhC/CoxF family [Rubellimicrobium mesophilum DSM 19309]|uniref:Xanthine and CO dehydrogenase maturation factor, XdhC/CoxF family n=1 Tax=Rubellimicrobium mesophilum DSM 19309 TaxID=442562 RepID=A0A017HKJ4_9RHOB|nr:Xanthine and CO dehydrogenase maturation factor, XdhC/CoxF family [Rubellimicrobium mesophilum DSM 19309]